MSRRAPDDVLTIVVGRPGDEPGSDDVDCGQAPRTSLCSVGSLDAWTSELDVPSTAAMPPGTVGEIAVVADRGTDLVCA